MLNKKKILYLWIIVLFFIMFSFNRVFASKDIISGQVREALSINDSNEVIDSKGIEGINLELVDNNGNKIYTKTDTDGNFTFTLENAKNYNIQFSYPNVKIDELNNIHDQAEFEVIRNKLKYNAQDYMVSSTLPSYTQTVNKTGEAHVYMILDVSGSMKSRGSSGKSRIEDLKEIVPKLIEQLLSFSKNIKIELITVSYQYSKLEV